MIDHIPKRHEDQVNISGSTIFLRQARIKGDPFIAFTHHAEFACYSRPALGSKRIMQLVRVVAAVVLQAAGLGMRLAVGHPFFHAVALM